ncbi:LPXTG cell wall anchor domain-containing protein [Vagococcus sp. CY52-2]|uniref:LPXTG cell wall anchor domain-containing protein n=1 Tax=Vagococcus sp. CY52-2 TaxID=2925838 RepID=UPI001F5A7074|nr:LPXTG cell wall anchor domain-containing protein [Vagococcus sp. CY52-2]UNM89561.1 LPXTG cell wall anchor domain-containing protein [Vagococcus sp. CY52-2]
MKSEAAGQDAWEEATKPSTPSEDWNTPTAEEGKTTEDAHKDAWENEANDALKDSSKKDDGVKDSSKKVATKTIEKNEVKNNEKTLPQTNEKMNMGLVIGGISSALASAFMFFRRK